MNLNQITLPVNDMGKAAKFYQILGFTQIVDTEHYARFECPNGETTFSIHQVETLPKGAGIVVYFECDDLEEQVINLVEKGIEFETLPDDKPWLW